MDVIGNDMMLVYANGIIIVGKSEVELIERALSNY